MQICESLHPFGENRSTIDPEQGRGFGFRCLPAGLICRLLVFVIGTEIALSCSCLDLQIWLPEKGKNKGAWAV